MLFSANIEIQYMKSRLKEIKPVPYVELEIYDILNKRQR